MTLEEQPARNPWWIVVGACIAQVVGMGPLLQFTFSVFLLPLSAEFHADRGATTLALTSALMASALCIPFAGALIDRFNVRRLTSAAILALAIGLIALSVLVHSLVAFVVVFTLAGAVSSLQTPLPYTKVITARFDEDRGLALGVALAGVGIGTIIAPQVAQALIQHWGWRGGYFGLAVLLLVIALPAVQLCMPDGVGVSAVPARAEILPGQTLGEALVSSRFWRILVCFFLGAAAANGVIAHLVPMAHDAGFAAGAAVPLLSIVGLFSMLGRVLAGKLADRFWAPGVASFFFCLVAAGIVALLLGPGQIGLWRVAAVMVGLGLGAEAHLIGFMLSRYCGPRAFGRLFGLQFGGFILASSLGPLLMGWWFVYAGSYRGALIGLAAALGFAALLFLSLGRYGFPPAGTSERRSLRRPVRTLLVRRGF